MSDCSSVIAEKPVFPPLNCLDALVKNSIDRTRVVLFLHPQSTAVSEARGYGPASDRRIGANGGPLGSAAAPGLGCAWDSAGRRHTPGMVSAEKREQDRPLGTAPGSGPHRGDI